MDFKKIKAQTWYRQETEGTPYFIYGPCLGCLYYFKNPEGIFWYCDTDSAKAYLSKNLLCQQAEKVFAKEKKSPGYLKKIFNQWQAKVQKKNEKIITEIKNTDLQKINNQKLIRLNKKLADQYFYMWAQFYVDIFDLDSESLVESELVIAGITLNDEDRNTMMMQEVPIAHQQAERGLLKIAKLIKQTPGAVNTLSYISSPANLHRLKTYPKILKALEAYQQKYFWMANSWAHTKVITIFDYVENIKQILSGPRDINKELQQLDNFSTQIKKRKQKIAKKYKLNRWLRQMFQFFALLAYWRDERKCQVQRIHHYQELLGREIASRSNLTWQQIKIIDSGAIDKIPVSKTLINKYTKLLTEQPIISWQKKPIHASKTQSKKVIKTIEDIIQSETTEIRGMIACPGKITGKVKVIKKQSEFSKMAKGDILVAVMTRPEYVPLMKKAAAIITDEGGITSHAAVISRELKVPCIIGTQVATQKLKDGDTVFVNANHGVVQIK